VIPVAKLLKQHMMHGITQPSLETSNEEATLKIVSAFHAAMNPEKEQPVFGNPSSDSQKHNKGSGQLVLCLLFL
jgi:hypothetical protein